MKKLILLIIAVASTVLCIAAQAYNLNGVLIDTLPNNARYVTISADGTSAYVATAPDNII